MVIDLKHVNLNEPSSDAATYGRAADLQMRLWSHGQVVKLAAFQAADGGFNSPWDYHGEHATAIPGNVCNLALSSKRSRRLDSQSGNVSSNLARVTKDYL